MFYISHIEPNNISVTGNDGIERYYDTVGVMDTEDGVEEYYTKPDLEKLIRANSFKIKIEGMTYTGSKFVYERKNESIVRLERLNRGDSFRLVSSDGTSNEVLYIGENGVRDFLYFDSSGNKYILKRKHLLSGMYSVRLDSVHRTSELRSLYKQLHPTSQLSQFI